VPAALRQVRAAGGQPGEPKQEPYGLVADCADDQGVAFALVEVPAPPQGRGKAAGRHGDLAYVTMEVTDASAARAFYGSVLGWRFSAGSVPDGWRVEKVLPMVGLVGGRELAMTVPMYRVDDIATAVQPVRAAGGTATAASRRYPGLHPVQKWPGPLEPGPHARAFAVGDEGLDPRTSAVKAVSRVSTTGERRNLRPTARDHRLEHARPRMGDGRAAGATPRGRPQSVWGHG
jgi:predicted enzyme related to lactoylglutathione lyase